MATTQLKTQTGNNVFPKVECIDNLTSTDTATPLSAKQGKVLNDKYTSLSNTTNTTNSNFESRISALESSAYVFDLPSLSNDSITETQYNELIDAIVANAPITISYNDGDHKLIIPSSAVNRDGDINIKFSEGNVLYELYIASGDVSTSTPYSIDILSSSSNASSVTAGPIKTGYTKNGNKYPVTTDTNNNAYVDLSTLTIEDESDIYVFTLPSLSDGTMSTDEYNKLLNAVTSNKSIIIDYDNGDINKFTPISIDTSSGDIFIRFSYGNNTIYEISISPSGGSNVSYTITTTNIINVATNANIGGIKTGYTQSGTKYPVKVDSNGNAYTELSGLDTGSAGLEMVVVTIGGDTGTVTQDIYNKLKAITADGSTNYMAVIRMFDCEMFYPVDMHYAYDEEATINGNITVTIMYADIDVYEPWNITIKKDLSYTFAKS